MKPAIAPIPSMSQHRKDAESEAWICARLKLPGLFLGHTSTEIRRDRLKAVLLERGLTESIAGRRDGKAITWRALFKQLYGDEIAS
jgi:hypothetical protein